MRKIIAISLVSGNLLYKENGKYFMQSPEKIEVTRLTASNIVYAFRYFKCCYAPKNY